jgi:uncharacterized protein (TIGR00730 family)
MVWKEFKEAFTYLNSFWRYAYGLWRISRLKQPIVTIFGGKRADKTSDYYLKASHLAGMLVKHGISVLTGGGPGIMEAALCGGHAYDPRGRTLGIGVNGVDVSFRSSCGQETIYLADFATRKKLLINHSMAFIVFPGGLGTMDEISEVLNLIKTRKIEAAPVILIGTEYWQSFVDWFLLALKKDFIAPEHARVFEVTDDIVKVADIMNKRMMMLPIKGN